MGGLSRINPDGGFITSHGRRCYTGIVESRVLYSEVDMRRRVKRRLFLMSMALATGTCGHAFAQGGRNAAGEGHHFGGEFRDSALPLPDNEGLGRGSSSSTMLGRVRQALTGVVFGGEAGTVSTAARGWRLELLQAEPGTGMSGDQKIGKAKVLGVTLRVTF